MSQVAAELMFDALLYCVALFFAGLVVTVLLNQWDGVLVTLVGAGAWVAYLRVRLGSW